MGSPRSRSPRGKRTLKLLAFAEEKMRDESPPSPTASDSQSGNTAPASKSDATSSGYGDKIDFLMEDTEDNVGSTSYEPQPARQRRSRGNGRQRRIAFYDDKNKYSKAKSVLRMKRDNAHTTTGKDLGIPKAKPVLGLENVNNNANVEQELPFYGSMQNRPNANTEQELPFYGSMQYRPNANTEQELPFYGSMQYRLNANTVPETN